MIGIELIQIFQLNFMLLSYNPDIFQFNKISINSYTHIDSTTFI